MLTDYTAGTVSITDGTTDLVGVGTAWATAGFRAGDIFLKNNRSAVIASVNSDTSITLEEPWDAGDLAAASYRMRFQPVASRLTAMAQSLYELLGSGNNQALASLVGAAGKVPVFTGPGALAVVDRSEFVDGVHADANVDTIADRAAYDAKPGPTDTAPGFSVLVADVGDGRSAIYYKMSDTPADWSDPAYITGPQGSQGDQGDPGLQGEPGVQGEPGPANSLAIGTVEGGVAAGATITGAAPNQTLNLTLPKGDKGDKGDTGNITGLTAFWQNIVTTKADAPTSRAALEIAFADQAGAEAGTAQDTYMNPLRTAQAIAARANATAITSTSNLDALADGWYRWVSDAPTGAPTLYAIMLQRNDGGQPIQIVFGGLKPQAIYMRRKSAGVWETFTKIGDLPTTVVRGASKMWANLNGSGTVALRDSLNISSVTDNGPGNYTFAYTNAMEAANYSATSAPGSTATGQAWAVILPGNQLAAGQIVYRGYTYDLQTAQDTDYAYIEIVGDLA